MPNTKYIFFDINDNYIKTWNKRLSNEKNIPFTTSCINLKDIKANYYISPANGFGQLDGGIDKIYRNIYPGLQNEVNNKLSPYKHLKPHIGVGSAIIVDIPNRKNKLILAPTMDHPSKLDGPWNCFWSSLAIFYLVSRLNNTEDNVIAIPGLCTGTGHIDAKEMMDMCVLAYKVSNKHSLEDFLRIYLPDINSTTYNSRELILSKSLHERAIPANIYQNI